MDILKDLADKTKEEAIKFKDRFSPTPLPVPPIVPPTEAAIVVVQAAQPIVPAEDPIKAKPKQTALSPESSVLAKNLQTSFHLVDHFYGKTAKQNINIRSEHKEAFDYVLRRIAAGEVTDNPVLREQSDQEIIRYFLDGWSQARLSNSAATQNTPLPATRNPFILVARSVRAGVSAASAFVSPVSPPVAPTEIPTQDFIQYLLDLFKELLANIREDATSNILLKISRWPAGLIVSPPELGLAVKGQRLSENVLIQTCVEELGQIYRETYQDHDEASFRDNPQEFFTAACLALHSYYRELKKVNTYLKTNQRNAYLWKNENLQQALSYYFEQGKYLYEIHAMLENVPLEVRTNKISLMGKYETYIKEMYKREETYTRTSGPFAFGYDKWTKIEAAMEQYRYLRGLPHDILPRPSPERLELMHFAGEQGRLKDLKAQGLFLGYGRGTAEDDPFVPLNFPTRLEPMRL